jgi:hypothetical protein
MYFSDCFGLSQRCVNEVGKAKNKLLSEPQGDRGEKVDIDEQLHTADQKDGQGRGDGAKRRRNTGRQRGEGRL